MPAGDIIFKFIIDESRWECSTDFPTCQDMHGNTNNKLTIVPASPPIKPHTEAAQPPDECDALFPGLCDTFPATPVGMSRRPCHAELWSTTTPLFMKKVLLC